MRGLLGNVGQLLTNSLYLENLFAFLELRPTVADPERPLQAPTRVEREVRFRGVTFGYPGSERAALENFDLTVPAGGIVAVVGPNGAGKTTLVKLLCRFYDPRAGSVEIDGVDIRRFGLEALRRMTTVLFQFPMEYQATASENIAMSDVRAERDPEAIRRAAEGAGSHELVERLPDGYDTQLGKWFANGAELSGGEWQRIALARAYWRRSPIVVLDEPTSFMDSWAEAEWFERFRELASGRTAIVITHRFTIAMRADVIHVMDGGRVVESGSHKELLALGGLYAESWREQMRAHDATPEESRTSVTGA
jgi:ATP-binding cassette subfamily B protein